MLKHMQAQIPSSRFISSCKHMKIPRDYEVDSKLMLLKSVSLQELLSTWMSLSTDGSSSIFLFGTVKNYAGLFAGYAVILQANFTGYT